MINNVKLRTKIKYSLIGLNCILFLIFLFLLIFWLISIRPSQIQLAKELNHYYLYSIYELPNNQNEIQPDYIGNNHLLAKADTKNEQYNQDTKGISNNNEMDELIQKLNNLLLDKKSKEANALSKKLDNNNNNANSDFPKLALIITNLGLSRRATELSLSLPVECALGFVPYTKSLKPLLYKAKARGHEIYLFLPMETINAQNQHSNLNSNSNKFELLSSDSMNQNFDKLSKLLKTDIKYNGLYTSYNQIFTKNQDAAEMLFTYLANKNSKLIINENSHNIELFNNIIPISLVIDDEPEQETIQAKLNDLVNIAKKNGTALGYSQGFTLTIEEIKAWSKDLSTKGVKLVPISGLIKEKIL